MNIDIRNSIVENFRNTSIDEIKESIEQSIKNKDEITLPGLGVFFEQLWVNTTTDEKNLILNILLKSFNF